MAGIVSRDIVFGDQRCGCFAFPGKHLTSRQNGKRSRIVCIVSWAIDLAAGFGDFLSPSERRTASLASNLRLGPSHLDHGCRWQVRIAVLLPYLLVGWCWYLGTLVPVIGIVQAGEQAMADRYTYLTQIGLYIALVWGMRDLSVHFPRLRNSIFVGTALISVCLTVAAWHQAGIWRDSETVFRHALRVTRDNDTVHTFLAEVFIDEGRYEEAEAHCYEALRIEPKHSGAFFELGRVFEERGELERSRDFYLKALDISTGTILRLLSASLRSCRSRDLFQGQSTFFDAHSN